MWGIHNDALSNELVDEGFISIGWDVDDIRTIGKDRDGLKASLARAYPEAKAWAIPREADDGGKVSLSGFDNRLPACRPPDRNLPVSDRYSYCGGVMRICWRHCRHYLTRDLRPHQGKTLDEEMH